MARIFGAPERVPAGNVARRVEGVFVFGESARHRRLDVLDVAVLEDVHELLDSDAAGLGDPPYVVARQVDEHRVFGAFLPVGEHLAGEAAVLDRRLPARARPRDRIRDDWSPATETSVSGLAPTMVRSSCGAGTCTARG